MTNKDIEEIQAIILAYHDKSNGGHHNVVFAQKQIQQLINEATKEARIEGRISGLKTAHRYKGNPFEVGRKVLREIDRLKELEDKSEL